MLACAEYEGDRLIKLRNPHGRTSHTAEWRGDWSDNDEKWTTKAQNTIGYKPDTNNPDGVFWMNIEDFVWEFKYLYVCRVLSEDDGWHSVKMEGAWKGPSSAGFRKLSKLPQYKIRISKPCKGFIQLRQHTEESTFRGKNTIMWMVQNEDGDRIVKVKREKLIGKSALINLNVVTSEISF